MPLDIDSTKSLRGGAALEQLVHAVTRAAEHDELASVEWKSSLDLSNSHGRFHVARCILAMANRDPDTAANEFGGCGYIVIGATPDGLDGVVSTDPAKYFGPINRYVDSDGNGPAWACFHVPVGLKTVAVFVVEPPEAGHGAWPLRRTYRDASGDGADEGTIFVRSPGRTAPATATQIEMLNRRAAAVEPALPEIEVALEGAIPLSWFNETTLGDEITGWSLRRARSMIQIAHRIDAERHPADPEPRGTTSDVSQTGSGAAFSAVLAEADRVQRELDLAMRKVMSANVFGTLGQTSGTDRRSLQTFEAEVNNWSVALSRAARASFDALYHQQGHGEVVVLLVNRSKRFLENVRLKVLFPWPVGSASDEEPRPRPLPAPPRPFGELDKGTSALAEVLRQHGSLDAVPSFLAGVDHSIDPIRRTWVENGSMNIVFELDELWPHDTLTSDPIWIRLPARPSSGVLEGTWELTAKDIHGVVSGAIAVATSESPINPADVLRPVPANSDDPEHS